MRDVNCFWYSGSLGDIEQICFLSMLRQGHRVRLFHYEPLKNVPAGIELVDARELLPLENFIFHRQTGSPSLGSNRIRYLMMAQGLGYWLDADVILIKPLPEDDFVFGWEDKHQINGAVLYLKQGAPLTNAVVKFAADRHPIPPFYPPKDRKRLVYQALIEGKPVDVQDLPWGVYGPQALTHFITRHGMAKQARPPKVFYPIHHSAAHSLVTARFDISHVVNETTVAIHLWNEKLRSPSILRPKNPHGTIIIERGCYVDRFAREELGFKIKELA